MSTDLLILMPEIILLSFISVIILVDVYLSNKLKFVTYLFTQVAIITTAVVLYLQDVGPTTIFIDQLVIDPVAKTLKLVILGIIFLVLLYSRTYVKERDIAQGEFHILTLFSTLGMMLLVSANSMLMIYLGLELTTLPLYVLVALNRNNSASVEAGMKYFIMGALASGLFLYGISMVFGITGSIQLGEIANQVRVAEGNNLTILLFALVFIISGIAFKLGAVPFHMWVPDIYQGSPTNITLLIGSAPKIAAFGMAYRLLNDGLVDIAPQWGQILMLLGILSLAIGNVVAIVQTNIKRLLAYSTIGHVGYICLALLAGPKSGFSAAMYYMVVYAIVVCAGFGILLVLSRQGFEAENIEDLNGLAERSPWLAFLMLLVAFSLAGVPPTVGFYAKLMVLRSLVDIGAIWLAVVAVAFSIIGAFYYLRVIRAMYFESPKLPTPISGSLDLRIVLSVNGLSVLVLGIFPAPLYMLCYQAFI